MTRTRRRLATAAAIATVSLSGIAGMTTARASAPPLQHQQKVAVSCYGDYCSGQDPQSTGCANDAYTTAATNLSGAQLQVRWSPTCRTNWARLVVYPTNGCVSSGNLVARQDTGYIQSKWLGAVICYVSVTQTWWTPMIYSPVHLVRGEIGSSTTAWS